MRGDRVDTTQAENKDRPDEGWDEIKTISELEKLKAHIEYVIQGTEGRLGIHHGYAADGTVLMEHPLGKCIAGVRIGLEATYQKYGQEMYKQGLLWDGSITVVGDDEQQPQEPGAGAEP